MTRGDGTTSSAHMHSQIVFFFTLSLLSHSYVLRIFNPLISLSFLCPFSVPYCSQVLLGLPYSMAIDMWSLGCIAAELFLGLPVFPGTNEHNQLSRIIEMHGYVRFAVRCLCLRLSDTVSEYQHPIST